MSLIGSAAAPAPPAGSPARPLAPRRPPAAPWTGCSELREVAETGAACRSPQPVPSISDVLSGRGGLARAAHGGPEAARPAGPSGG